MLFHNKTERHSKLRIEINAADETPFETVRLGYRVILTIEINE